MNTQLALTYRLTRRGHGQYSPATDNFSITIGSYYDAPLNARRLDKKRIPSTATTSSKPILSITKTHLPVKTSTAPSPST
jgi:hypothetical protein